MIPVNQPVFAGNERKYLLECIDSGWISSEGPFIQRFEAAFAERLGRRHAIAVSNGSAALDAAIAALDIGPGDEVILPTFTIISCIQQVVRSGATPVLVDSEPDTWNMSASEVAAKINDRTRAIIAVHIYGLPVDLDPILAIAQRSGIALIEDAAEVLGQEYRGRPCGSFGELSTFSFYPNKHVTTGEGGMIATDDPDLAQRCRGLRNLCFQEGRRFVHEDMGWNLRMTNMQAAVGLAQLERLDQAVERKREIGRQYQRLLGGLRGVQLPLIRTAFAENIYWVFGIVLGDELSIDAIELQRRLAVLGIGTRPFFYPMHLQPVLRRMGLFENDRFPVAERLASRGLYLPSGLAISDEQIEEVADAVARVLE